MVTGDGERGTDEDLCRRELGAQSLRDSSSISLITSIWLDSN